MAVYNMLGRRDNKYKARIKSPSTRRDNEEIRAGGWRRNSRPASRCSRAPINGLSGRDITGAISRRPPSKRMAPGDYETLRQADPVLSRLHDTNVARHRHHIYAILTVS